MGIKYLLVCIHLNSVHTASFCRVSLQCCRDFLRDMRIPLHNVLLRFISLRSKLGFAAPKPNTRFQPTHKNKREQTHASAPFCFCGWAGIWCWVSVRQNPTLNAVIWNVIKRCEAVCAYRAKNRGNIVAIRGRMKRYEPSWDECKLIDI